MVSSIRQGGTVIRPSTGQQVHWTPIEPVADEYDTAIRLGVPVLGVIGDRAHLYGSGGHTPWCSEGLPGHPCVPGKVYAIDLMPPAALRFWPWFIGSLRAGRYRWVSYANCVGQQVSRVDGFTRTRDSDDAHLHLSGLAGHEQDSSTILRDWDAVLSGNNNQEDDMAWTQAQIDRATAQLDAISDIVDGGAGEAYKRSILRQDHGHQINAVTETIEEALTTALEPIIDRLKDIEKALGIS